MSQAFEESDNIEFRLFNALKFDWIDRGENRLDFIPSCCVICLSSVLLVTWRENSLDINRLICQVPVGF